MHGIAGIVIVTRAHTHTRAVVPAQCHIHYSYSFHSLVFPSYAY